MVYIQLKKNIVDYESSSNREKEICIKFYKTIMYLCKNNRSLKVNLYIMYYFNLIIIGTLCLIF